MFVQPYLYFDGRCDEALEFYKRALGAEVLCLFRFNENPDPQMQIPPGMEQKVMHANVQIRDTELMVSDGQCRGTAKFDGFSLTLNVDDVADAEKVFAAVGEGGQVQMPLAETFFAHRFGMVADKFGVVWMVIAAKPPQA